MNGRMGAGLNNQRQEVTGVRCAAQPCTDPIGAVVAFGDGQNEVHATRMTQAGERWKTLELHCGDNVLARIALAAARCQGSRRHSHGLTHSLQGRTLLASVCHRPQPKKVRVAAELGGSVKGHSLFRIRTHCLRHRYWPKSIAAQVHDIDWASQTPGGEEERIGDWGAAAPGALDALVEIPPLPNRGFPRRHPQLLTPYTG